MVEIQTSLRVQNSSNESFSVSFSLWNSLLRSEKVVLVYGSADKSFTGVPYSMSYCSYSNWRLKKILSSLAYSTPTKCGSSLGEINATEIRNTE